MLAAETAGENAEAVKVLFATISVPVEALIKANPPEAEAALKLQGALTVIVPVEELFAPPVLVVTPPLKMHEALTVTVPVELLFKPAVKPPPLKIQGALTVTIPVEALLNPMPPEPVPVAVNVEFAKVAVPVELKLHPCVPITLPPKTRNPSSVILVAPVTTRHAVVLARMSAVSV